MEVPEIYEEEVFGILTEDELYLDCTLVKPRHASDAQLKGIRVWVPKLPLTQSSVITCARQEVIAGGLTGKLGHLVFDLRGTGYSDYKDDQYENDLTAIRLWAEERFGKKVRLGFFGTPNSPDCQVDLIPMRSGVLMEQYVYPVRGRPSNKTVLYLATYGNFGEEDELICRHLSENGYHVHAVDPLRYLLHASSDKRLTPQDLWDDFRQIAGTLYGPPVIFAQPVASGLGLMWAAGVEHILGVVAIGRTQLGFMPKHIFKNDNPHTYFVSRYVNKISPQPVALVLDGRAKREDADEIATLYQMAKEPRRLEHIRQVTPEIALSLVNWIQSGGKK